MLILIAPAKRMRPTIDFMDHKRMPCFLSESERLVTYLKTKKQEELKAMLNCSDAIAEWTYNSYQHMDVNVSCVPALLSFDGIQYSYMAPDLFQMNTSFMQNGIFAFYPAYMVFWSPLTASYPIVLNWTVPFVHPFAQAYMISGEASPING